MLRGANASGLRIPNAKEGLALLALATFALAGCAEQPSEPEPGTNPPLYEIANETGAIEGWMLGTIHALPNRVEWRTETIDRVIEEADFLVVEIADLDDEQALADIYAELAISPDLPPLAQRLPPSHRPALSQLIERSGLDAERFRTTETWAAALALAQVDAQDDPRNGVDRAAIQAFRGRDIQEFEGAVVQLSIFDTLPEGEQRDLLAGVVIEARSARENPGKLRDAWLKGDLEELERATTTGIMADPELRDALLVKRNEAWTGKLSAMLRDDRKPLVAVGAAHLVGDDSLPALLERRGYSVRRIGR